MFDKTEGRTLLYGWIRYEALMINPREMAAGHIARLVHQPYFRYSQVRSAAGNLKIFLRARIGDG